MTLFYDPVKRKPRLWVTLVFIIIPIACLAAFWIVAEDNTGEITPTKKTSTTDIFKDLE